MLVKPAEGLKIYDPFKKDYLPPEGREVPDGDLYWERLRIDRDVSVVQPDPAPPIQTPAKTSSDPS
jgi:hypothetical protein